MIEIIFLKETSFIIILKHTGGSVAVNPSQQKRLSAGRDGCGLLLGRCLSCWVTNTQPCHPASDSRGPQGPCLLSSVVSKRQAEIGGAGGAGCFPFNVWTNRTTVNIPIHNLNRPGLKLMLSSFGVRYIISQQWRKMISIAQSFYT